MTSRILEIASTIQYRASTSRAMIPVLFPGLAVVNIMIPLILLIHYY